MPRRSRRVVLDVERFLDNEVWEKKELLTIMPPAAPQNPAKIELRIVTADILDVAADAIFLTCDSASPKMLGNVGAQFLRRFPQVALQRCMGEQIWFPAALGSAHRVKLSTGSPYRWAMILVTLHHVPVLSREEKLKVIRRAFYGALDACPRIGVEHAVTTVLAGSWRLPADEAFRQMLEVINTVRNGPKILTVCVREGEEELGELARKAEVIE